MNNNNNVPVVGRWQQESWQSIHKSLWALGMQSKRYGVHTSGIIICIMYASPFMKGGAVVRREDWLNESWEMQNDTLLAFVFCPTMKAKGRGRS